LAAFLPAADGQKDEIAIGILRRIWKEGANPQRVPRASRHVVASKVADTNLALFWRRAKRKPFSV
jgi:hypothetical protein